MDFYKDELSDHYKYVAKNRVNRQFLIEEVHSDNIDTHMYLSLEDLEDLVYAVRLS